MKFRLYRGRELGADEFIRRLPLAKKQSCGLFCGRLERCESPKADQIKEETSNYCLEFFCCNFIGDEN